MRYRADTVSVGKMFVATADPQGKVITGRAAIGD
jgi:hypothetical protein